jgi:Protein of unknown function (DUF2934)
MSYHPTRDELLQKEDVRQAIAERAYLIAEKQGFAPGRDLANWLEAEAATLEQFLSEKATAKAVLDASSANGAAPAKPARKPAAKVTPVKETPAKAAAPAAPKAVKAEAPAKPAAKTAKTTKAAPAPVEATPAPRKPATKKK